MIRVESEGWAGSQTLSSLAVHSDVISDLRATSSTIEKRLRSKRAAGQHRVQPQAALPPRIKQRLNHKCGSLHQVSLDQRSRDAQDAVPPTLQLAVPRRIMSALRLVTRIPINLDDERGLASEKVHDVVPNDDLPTKLHTEQALAAHQAPHERLSVSGMMTKRPSALFEKRLARGALSQRM